MTLRERIADWITGGKYSRALDRWSFYRKHALNRGLQLHAIAAMETKNANATVRRMARTAQEAVK